VTGPGFQQSAVHAEVLQRDAIPSVGLGQHLIKEPLRDVAGQQPVAILREHGRVPNGIVHVESDEPAEEQLVIQLLD
jgi:hypothetical protein